MSTARALIKLTLFILVVLLYLAISFIGQLFIRDQRRRRIFFTHLVSAITGFGRWFMKIHVNVINLPSKDSNYLFIGNHMGMLDILVLSSIRPTLFVTSVEMRQTPGLGLLCEMGGCVFVERRSRNNIHGEIGQIREALKQGLSVTIYPEGTSTDGRQILPFKKSLLTAAAGTGVPILPVVLNYRKANGEPMSDKWRDYVCWYGDQAFPPSLWRLFSLKSVDADLEFLEPIEVTSEEQRREIATSAQAQITAKFAPIL